MISILTILICVIGVVVLIAAAIGIAMVMNSSDRDAVSSAREGWIQGRSEKDQQD